MIASTDRRDKQRDRQEIYVSGLLVAPMRRRTIFGCLVHLPGYCAFTKKAVETLEQLETLWSTANALKKRNCCDLQIAAVLTRGSLSKLSNSGKLFTPFFPYWIGRNDGSDGIQTHNNNLLHSFEESCLRAQPSACLGVPILKLAFTATPGSSIKCTRLCVTR